MKVNWDETKDLKQVELSKRLVEKYNVSRGAIYKLGSSRLMCGDSTSDIDVAALMGGARASVCFTSPPYSQQRDYKNDAKSGWDSLMQGVFLSARFEQNAQILVNLGMIHKNNEWQTYWDGWVSWMREQGWRRYGWYIWDKLNGFPGDHAGRFAPSHEFVFHFNKESVRPRKIIPTKPSSQKRIQAMHQQKARGEFVTGQRLKNGKIRQRSSFSTLGQSFKVPDSVVRLSPEKRRGIQTSLHPAVFPVELPTFFLRCWDGLIYEPFSGAGTTILAAHALERSCYAMEIMPEYVAASLERWTLGTGNAPVRI